MANRWYSIDRLMAFPALHTKFGRLLRFFLLLLLCRNMPEREVPSYHCMPDHRGSMATPPWSDQEYLLRTLQNHVSCAKCGGRVFCVPSFHDDVDGAEVVQQYTKYTACHRRR